MRASLIAVTALLLIPGTTRAQTCSSSTFIVAGRVATGSQPSGVAAADFNQDGHADLLAVSQYDGVSVYPGTGDGSFGAPIESAPFSNGSSFTAVGTFNSDANPDVAVALYGGGIDVLLGNGDGTFQDPVIYASADYVSGLVAADVTGDGNLDLVAGSQQISAIQVLAGNGDGTFAAPFNLSTLASPVDVTTGDFDGDGNIDIAATLASNLVEIFPGTGGGGFGTPTLIKVGGSLGPIVSGDFNSDGNLDLALGTGTYLAVIRGNGDGTFRAAIEYPSQFVLGRLVATDLDGDGKTDVVGLRSSYYYSLSGVVVPFLQQPDGSLAVVEAFLAGSGSQGIASADFNEDGIPDFATADWSSSTLSVLLGEQQGRLEAGIYLPLQTQTWVLVPGDFDGDGRDDLAAVGSSYDGPLQIVSALNGIASAGPVIELDSYPQAAAAADFNGDGFLDLAFTTYYAGVMIRFGNGDGTFQPPTIYPAGNYPRAIVAGDFTGDGWPDLAFTDHDNVGGPTISLLVNDGTGQFAAGPLTLVEHEISSLVAARLDPGATLDLAATTCCGPSEDGVFVLLGNGDGTFQPEADYAAGLQPIALATGDFNGDGALDLVAADGNSTTVAVLMNNGAGGFQPPTLLAIGFTPSGVAAADFDIDGKTDVVTVNQNSATISLLRGVGDGTFQAPVIYGAPGAASTIVPIAFGGQGPDLAIGAPGDMSLEILLNGHLSVRTLVAQTVIVGSPARFVASASGSGPLAYQWTRDGVPLSDGGSISGAQSPVLLISPSSFTDHAAYGVSVTDACGTVVSNAVELFVEFADVAVASPFHADILTIATAGVTAGCGGADYCPSALVTRDQMAVFLLKSEHGSAYVPPPCSGLFADVPCPSTYANWIEQLAAEGVTAGCGNGDYCPDASITRAQMAVFLLKTSQGSGYVPPAAAAIFNDVPVDAFAAAFIDDIYNRGITGGCQASPLLYCPGNAVLRQQMATFLVRTFFP